MSIVARVERTLVGIEKMVSSDESEVDEMQTKVDELEKKNRELRERLIELRKAHDCERIQEGKTLERLSSTLSLVKQIYGELQK
ncbi:MAG TPA: hypothetical protein VJK48_00685 [Chlamydiales bacterium]|nr:MAG: hypothetical protein A3F67_08485 [Verrucomicrobia bacterium RIFCSPHIGHO2_12_FULL_41_10]HLB52210.1 hypothetical protein [Chlamydiales bacterium]